MVQSHQVLRVIWVPPGQSREVLGGLLGVSILVSMLVMFMFWHTNPICKQQDACYDACGTPSVCTQTTSPNTGFTVNIMLKNSSISNDKWTPCFNTAVNWLATPGNPNTQLVCYFPNTADQSAIACVVPLQGDACELEKKYQKMLTGASSVAILISFMLVPRAIEFIFTLVFGVCCRAAFVRGQGKTVKGVSLGVLVLGGLGVLVVLLIVNGGNGFIGLRFAVWAATWVGSMVIFEPLAGLISYFLIRCDESSLENAAEDDETEHESKPLLGMSQAPQSLPEPSTEPTVLSDDQAPVIIVEDQQVPLDPSENA